MSLQCPYGLLGISLLILATQLPGARTSVSCGTCARCDYGGITLGESCGQDGFIECGEGEVYCKYDWNNVDFQLECGPASDCQIPRCDEVVGSDCKKASFGSQARPRSTVFAKGGNDDDCNHCCFSPGLVEYQAPRSDQGTPRGISHLEWCTEKKDPPPPVCPCCSYCPNNFECPRQTLDFTRRGNKLSCPAGGYCKYEFNEFDGKFQEASDSRCLSNAKITCRDGFLNSKSNADGTVKYECLQAIMQSRDDITNVIVKGGNVGDNCIQPTSGNALILQTNLNPTNGKFFGISNIQWCKGCKCCENGC